MTAKIQREASATALSQEAEWIQDGGPEQPMVRSEWGQLSQHKQTGKSATPHSPRAPDASQQDSPPGNASSLPHHYSGAAVKEAPLADKQDEPATKNHKIFQGRTQISKVKHQTQQDLTEEELLEQTGRDLKRGTIFKNKIHNPKMITQDISQ